MRSPFRWLLLAVCACAAAPAIALDPTQVAVIVNTWDPASVEIGEYYAAKRGIPFRNFVRIGFRPGRSSLGEREFSTLRAWVEEQVQPQVQAYALTWAAPYRVECMSITSAFAFGFDAQYCASECGPTRPSPYFNSQASLPYTQLGVRLSMAVAAGTLEQTKALIDRGVGSDGSFPKGVAYLLSTSDAARNVRSQTYPTVERLLRGKPHLRVKVVAGDVLRGAQDVLFYFTGRAKVEALETLAFLPGAMADHLTSFGGQLTDSGQMSALAWLAAGATGSYGAVVEPCNLPQKFPHPAIAIGSYLRGDSLIEAYWKSVAMPGQGVFIGEPLAKPFHREHR
jgi:uncharacterized protein (TIGR03790 family)